MSDAPITGVNHTRLDFGVTYPPVVSQQPAIIKRFESDTIYFTDGGGRFAFANGATDPLEYDEGAAESTYVVVAIAVLCLVVFIDRRVPDE
jgi:hypothetical protein